MAGSTLRLQPPPTTLQDTALSVSPVAVDFYSASTVHIALGDSATEVHAATLNAYLTFAGQNAAMVECHPGDAEVSFDPAKVVALHLCCTSIGSARDQLDNQAELRHGWRGCLRDPNRIALIHWASFCVRLFSFSGCPLH